MDKAVRFLCVLGLLVTLATLGDSVLNNLFNGAMGILNKGGDQGSKKSKQSISNVTISTGVKELCFDELGCFSMEAPWTSLLRPLPPPWAPSQINTHLNCFTRKSSQQFNVTLWPKISLNGLPFDGKKTTVFITHGFINNANEPWCANMKNAYLNAADANVCLVDWGGGAITINYLQAASNTRIVGAEIARFIRYLGEHHGLTTDRVHLIGHSLGSHISGYAAKYLTGIRRITALDPAQPGFEFCPKEVRLHKDDALFVDAIHTNAAPFIPTMGFGLMSPTGHVDFYVNGGLRQPGCTLPSMSNIKSVFDLATFPIKMITTLVACSHCRAIDYFTQSLKPNCTIWGRSCSLTRHILGGTLMGFIDPTFSKVETCTKKTCSPMGLETPQFEARGIFAVATPSTPPYCDSREESNKILLEIMESSEKGKDSTTGTSSQTIDIVESVDSFKANLNSKLNIVWNTTEIVTNQIAKLKKAILILG